MNAQLRDPHEFSAADVAAQLMERLQHRRSFPLICRDGEHLVLFDRYEDGTERERYDVPVVDLQRSAGVAFWVRQLAPKTWVTKEHLELLAQAVIDLETDTTGF